MHKLPDIYFTPEYGRLYEKHEGGTLESFSYTTGYGVVTMQFIKRPITLSDRYEAYSDIITPYGYGGPLFIDVEETKKTQLARQFGEAFRSYCMDEKIVSAFIRFHPILNNAATFAPAFDEIVQSRKTIAINLKKDLLSEEFDVGIRKSCRRAPSRGIQLQYDTELETLDSFISQYNALMRSKHAKACYFFPTAYFNALKTLAGSVEIVNAKLGSEIIASVLYLKYGEFIHAHLAAATAVGYKNRAVETIKANRALRAQEEGFLWNHLGGGLTNDPNDSLLRFKRKFSKSEPFTFCLGRSIFDNEVYSALCALSEKTRQTEDTGFFPRYRAVSI